LSGEELHKADYVFRLSREKFLLVEIKTSQTNTITLDFAMVRNQKPYAKLAKGHTIIKDSALKESLVQLIVNDTETQVVFLKMVCATTATVISV